MLFLHLDELPIFRKFTGELFKPRKHILAHMGHDESFRLQLVQVSHQGLKIQVKLDFLGEKVRLCNQEISSSGCRHKGFGPFCISRIGNGFPLRMECARQGTGLPLDAERGKQ